MVFVSYCATVVDHFKRKTKESQVTKWLPWEEALKAAKKEGKPIFILIQDPDCEGCRVFKEEFSASVKARELSSEFILASIQRSKAPKNLRQDGDYVPRVYFAFPDGEIMTVFNELGNPRRKFNYPTIRSLLVSMTDVIKLQKTKQ